MPAQETQTKSIVLEALAGHFTCAEKLPAKDPNVRSFEAKSQEVNYFFDEINKCFIHMTVQIGKSKFTSPVSVSHSDLVQTIRALDQLNRIRRLCPKGKPHVDQALRPHVRKPPWFSNTAIYFFQTRVLPGKTTHRN